MHGWITIHTCRQTNNTLPSCIIIFCQKKGFLFLSFVSHMHVFIVENKLSQAAAATNPKLAVKCAGNKKYIAFHHPSFPFCTYLLP